MKRDRKNKKEKKENTKATLQADVDDLKRRLQRQGAKGDVSKGKGDGREHKGPPVPQAAVVREVHHGRWRPDLLRLQPRYMPRR